MMTIVTVQTAVMNLAPRLAHLYPPSLPLPGFYCKNKGHVPLYVNFQRVNDGVCDYDICCDGSDEWAHVGGLKCEDKCKEIGKQWKKTEEEKDKSYATALRKRKELVAKSSKTKREMQERISVLEKEAQELEVSVKDLEAELETVRANNRGKSAGGQKQGKAYELAQLAKTRTDTLRTVLAEVHHQRDQVVNLLREAEGILSKFKEEYNPNFNDEGVKRAVRSWEDYIARKEEGDGDLFGDADLFDALKPEHDEPFNDPEQWAEEAEVGLIYKLAYFLPASVVNSIEDSLSGLRSALVSNGLLADNSLDSDSNEPRAVKEARDRVSNAQSSLDSKKSEIKRHKGDLEHDFGADSVFRALKGECISKDSGEYTYELCWMEQTKQKSKKGRGDTTMGNFEKISSMVVDEATPSGQIVQKTKVTLLYTNGQSCWNGPSRSTTVILECGENNELTKISEDEKCIYSIFVTTPAVCDSPGKNEAESSGKDEL
ncbi:glucosidase 2 subunit beta [Arthroderma uncinatum]|uniref:glucosidase 2 subunit beta n=1 Tax=Arthroderma uncinatum TaxID=74035 RepID=UPI00144A5560|nr:glucosidase 2 subunit beta [Arthroderma uncinatum]KAF3491123.1 glucosidase 2 subunit beta [Arthroderma uncinatum]